MSSRPFLIALTLLLAASAQLAAQEDPGRSPADSATASDSVYTSDVAGEFRPAKGFDIFRNSRISLNVSFYGLFRFLDQLPGDQMFVDHLGRETTKDIELRMRRNEGG